MAPGLFTTEQLMELAGLAVATCVQAHYRADIGEIVIVCGPGNSGGDGLVAARHLRHFGHRRVTVVYPRDTDKTLYLGLLELCKLSGVTVSKALPEFFTTSSEENEATRKSALVIDAVFGCSFKGTPRDPFATMLTQINASGVRCVAVNIPSTYEQIVRIA